MTTVHELANVTGALLAGGKGTRLRTVIDDRPKPLANVRGRPFAAYLLDQLSEAGLAKVVLCTGYRAQDVYDAFGDSYRDLSLAYSQEHKPLGTAGALRLALQQFETELVLVMNGDSYCETDLRAAVEWHQQRGARCTVLLAKVDDVERYGCVHTDSEGHLLSFAEKSGPRGPGWVNAGVYLIERGLLETIPPEGETSLEREVFPEWIGQGLYGLRVDGRFIDIGTPESYALAERFVGV